MCPKLFSRAAWNGAFYHPSLISATLFPPWNTRLDGRSLYRPSFRLCSAQLLQDIGRIFAPSFDLLDQINDYE